MDERNSGAAVTGLVVGALVALGFAILISLLPAWVVLETRWRVVTYIAVALAAPDVGHPSRRTGRSP
jgi:RsiW-degrading membrane proteinase PrsW (M82 family)